MLRMHKCADCGADAEIFDRGVPFCVLCIEARDAGVRTSAFFTEVLTARQQYRDAMQDLANAKAIIEDCRNRDGDLALQQANANFSTARQRYEAAVNALIAEARKRTEP